MKQGRGAELRGCNELAWDRHVQRNPGKHPMAETVRSASCVAAREGDAQCTHQRSAASRAFEVTTGGEEFVVLASAGNLGAFLPKDVVLHFRELRAEN
eukprot:5439690-Pyramimonas_sp.AAC.2